MSQPWRLISALLPKSQPQSPCLNLFWVASPKGTKSCREQGDFCLSVRLSICLFVRLFVPPLASNWAFQVSNQTSQVSKQASLASNWASQSISLLQYLVLGRMNESPPVLYRTFSPLGPLPCSPSLKLTITQSRATGIAWATSFSMMAKVTH